jgi:hypothetical protein
MTNAGPDIDALIDQKVFGEPEGPAATLWHDRISGPVRSVAPYSKDWTYAMTVVEEMQKSRRDDGWFFLNRPHTGGPWLCEFGRRGCVVQAETGPMAVCLAALKYLGVEGVADPV